MGIWSNDDVLTSVPVTPMLYPAAALPLSTPHPRVETRDHVGAQELSTAQTASTYQLAPAFAVIDTASQTVVLDMVTTIPECNSQLDKVDLQTLTLSVGSTTIGTIAPENYGKDAYEKYAGIVEVPIVPRCLPRCRMAIFPCRNAAGESACAARNHLCRR